MHTNEELIQYLRESHALRTQCIIDAFRATDRKEFTKESPYVDRPFSIGHGQTISQPRVVAFMLELLQPQLGDRILDVGSGSAWTTALLSRLVGSKGKVYGVERIRELVELGTRNLGSRRNAQISQAKEMGLPEHAPYDRILVSASAEELPGELINQLRTGGVLVLPIKHSIWKITKYASGMKKEEHPGFVFVPLH